MNNKPPRTLFALWLALALAVFPALHAQETPPAAPAPAEKSAPVDKPAEAKKPAAPEATAEEEKPAGDSAAAREAAADKNSTAEQADKDSSEPAKPSAKENKGKRLHGIRAGTHGLRHSDNERVSFFQDSNLAAGEQADAVVSIFGSSTSAGEVSDAVVSIFGSSTSSGEVGDAVVSVIGNTRVTGGTVGDVAVAVMGSTYVNGHVQGGVVAVLGNVEFGPDAVVDGEIVCVGGEVIRDPKAVLHGNIQHIAIAGRYMNFNGLNAWFTHCLQYARPLAFGPHLMWAWCIALAFLVFYVLVALVAPEGVKKCVQTLEERPGKSILAGVLTLLLTPVAYLLLVLTLAIGIGFVLIPLFSLGLFFAGLFGKVVMLAWLGRRITKLFGDGPLAQPVFAVLIGGAIVLGLYTVPILGFVVYKLLGFLGLGVVIYTLLLMLKSNRAAAAAKAAAVAASRAAAAVPPTAGEVAGAAVTMLPPVISAATLPRAGFWRRIGATFLDFILISMVLGMLHGIFHWNNGGGLPLWFAIYNVVMWATKGTTIGGIVCGLKLVRLDDRPVDWGVAIVRGLSAFLSLAVAGLGFIWVAFDDEKQSWHDKIAGTTIVRVPKGTPLL
jgi:uncharacterized RDD family membrane protein YckC